MLDDSDFPLARCLHEAWSFSGLGKSRIQPRTILMMLQVAIFVPFMTLVGIQSGFASNELLLDNLDRIEEFSQNFCGKYWRKGEKLEENVTAKAEGELKGFLSEFLDVGGNLQIEQIVSKYTGPERDELFEANRLVRDCKVLLWIDLIALFKTDEPRAGSTGGTNDETKPENSRDNRADCTLILSTLDAMSLGSSRSNLELDTVRSISINFPECGERITDQMALGSNRRKASIIVSDEYMKKGRCTDARRVVENMSLGRFRDAQLAKMVSAMADGRNCR